MFQLFLLYIFSCTAQNEIVPVTSSPTDAPTWASNSTCDMTNCKEHCDQCAYVREFCHSEGLIDYMSLYYCHSKVAGVVVMVAMLFYTLSLLATTADNYFVPVLETLSKILHLKEDVAGVTLIALGNGAPDVFTSISAMQSNSDFPLMMGELLGASLFVSCIVLAAVILTTTVVVERNAILRDAFMLFGSTACSFVLSLDHTITFAEVTIFMVIYILYVTWVVYVGRKDLVNKVDSEYKRYMENEISMYTMEPRQRKSEVGKSCLKGCSKQSSSTTVSVIFNGFVTTVECPISILRFLSIGPVDGKWNKRQRWTTIVSWPLGFLIILLDMGKWSAFTEWSLVKVASDRSIYNGKLPLWSFALAIGAICGFLTFISTRNDQKPKFYVVFAIFSFAVTIAWLDMIANECVQVAESLGVIMGISTALLGSTVIAWGDSLGDLVANIAVARSGKPQAAVSACLAAPLLTDVLGICLALGTYTAKNGDLHFKANIHLYLGWFFLFGALPSVVLGFYVRRINEMLYQGTKALACWLIFLYLCFMVLTLLTEFTQMGSEISK